MKIFEISIHKTHEHCYSLQPISDCDASINDLVEQTTSDRWPIPQGHRPLRATGSALSVAVTLLEVNRFWILRITRILHSNH